jgi:hypothetical protein
MLYLSKVFCCDTHKVVKNDIVEKVVGRKFANGLLKADWVNGVFSCGKNLLFSIYIPSYRHNYELLIENGKIINVEYFQENPIEVEDFESIDTNEDKVYLYSLVEIPPQFVGKPAEIGFNEYVIKNLAQYDGVSARTFVEFIIEKDGSISNVELLRYIDPLIDAEVLRVISSSPHWRPGKVRGEAVRVKYVCRIDFNPLSCR